MNSEERFQDNPSGVITDTKHNMHWLPKDSWQDLGKWVHWEGAKAYTLTMKQVYAGGHSDWRMPTVEEALQLYDESLNQKNWEEDDIHIHTVFVTKCATHIWTSELDEEGKAACVNFLDGSTEYKDKTSMEEMATRLIRNIK